MSYNKLKSLVANVEAIETAMKIQVQGRQATAEEKEILSRYSGFGGIKEVLNIGTDKPIGGDMQEPIQRLQELINAYPHFTEPMRHNVIEGIKASVLTAFYTPKFLVDAVVRQIHATFSENGLKMRSFLEPSAGIGGFLPIAMSGTYDYAIEKDLISGMILSLLHENTLTRTAAFETIGEQGFEHTTFVYFVCVHIFMLLQSVAIVYLISFHIRYLKISIIVGIIILSMRILIPKILLYLSRLINT